MPDPKTTFRDLSGRFSGGFLSGICFKHSGKARIFIQNTPQVWNHEHVGDSWSHLHTVLTVFYLIFTLEISQNSADLIRFASASGDFRLLDAGTVRYDLWRPDRQIQKLRTVQLLQ